MKEAFYCEYCDAMLFIIHFFFARCRTSLVSGYPINKTTSQNVAEHQKKNYIPSLKYLCMLIHVHTFLLLLLVSLQSSYERDTHKTTLPLINCLFKCFTTLLLCYCYCMYGLDRKYTYKQRMATIMLSCTYGKLCIANMYYKVDKLNQLFWRTKCIKS